MMYWQIFYLYLINWFFMSTRWISNCEKIFSALIDLDQNLAIEFPVLYLIIGYSTNVLFA